MKLCPSCGHWHIHNVPVDRCTACFGKLSSGSICPPSGEPISGAAYADGSLGNRLIEGAIRTPPRRSGS